MFRNMVRAMTFRRVIVSLAAVWALSACSSGDTIVALNVSATDSVPVVDKLQVTFVQGSRRHVLSFAPPTEDPNGSADPPASIKNSFFERLTLPDGWAEEEVSIQVQAQDSDGNALEPELSDDTTVTLQPNGVVAAYVSLDIPAEPPPPSGEGGAGGGGGGGGGEPSVGGQGGGQGGEAAGGAPASGGAASAGEGGLGGAAGAEAIVAGAGGAL
jgi:hypothetical protein